MVVTNIDCSYDATKVALCLPGVMYKPFYWFTRCGSMLRLNWLFETSDCHQVPWASVPVAESYQVDDPHLLGLDPGLPDITCDVLQCRQPGGQEVDGDEAGEH